MGICNTAQANLDFSSLPSCMDYRHTLPYVHLPIKHAAGNVKAKLKENHHCHLPSRSWPPCFWKGCPRHTSCFLIRPPQYSVLFRSTEVVLLWVRVCCHLYKSNTRQKAWLCSRTGQPGVAIPSFPQVCLLLYEPTVYRQL